MKKLLSFDNPLLAKGGSVFNLSFWIGSILWVVALGVVLSVGVRVFNAINRRVPVGSPNVGLFQQDAQQGIQIL